MSGNCIMGINKKDSNIEKLIKLEKDFYKILAKLKDGVLES
ncbi:MAG: hypothetical protein E6377_10555 [Clostridium sp.]|nr:hypothetical protein [Clostridium sp.]MDU6876489.1 hypothetical protein [Clostridium sp.]MDU6935937.1 hypothetical protein [Clostridium sp.]